MVVLCEECFPRHEEHEVHCIIPLSPCAKCGKVDDSRFGGEVKTHSFPRNPIREIIVGHRRTGMSDF